MKKCSARIWILADNNNKNSKKVISVKKKIVFHFYFNKSLRVTLTSNELL